MHLEDGRPRPSIKSLRPFYLKLASRFINPVPKFFSRFKMRHVFGRQRHRIAGLWIAADSGWTVMQRKAPETSYLNPFTAGQCLTHLFQHAFYGQFDILVGQMMSLLIYKCFN